MEPNTAGHDRGCGVLLATAAGDALGAPYEFGPPLAADHRLAMTGGGPWAPGEWTDDTAMAIAIAETAATGADLRESDAQDRIVARWAGWARVAKDVGVQTRTVLSRASTAAAARQAAAQQHAQTGHTAGNGSLMRTGPVALAYLDDEDGLAQAATQISELTHFDPEAGEACVLWCFAIRHAVLVGELDVRVGLNRLDPDRRAVWAERIETAEHSAPADSSTTAGSSRRYKARGRRSQAWDAIEPIGYGSASRPRCAAAATPTRLPPSPAACSARRTVPRPSPSNGARP